MRAVSPEMYNLAGELLASPAGRGEPVSPPADAALYAIAALQAPLTRIVGLAGFQALLARAVALAKAEASWLGAVRVQEDATLAGFSEAALAQRADVAADGSAALLAQLLGLLTIFIGEALTLRIVQDAWPRAQLDDVGLGVEERPA